MFARVLPLLSGSELHAAAKTTASSANTRRERIRSMHTALFQHTRAARVTHLQRTRSAHIDNHPTFSIALKSSASFCVANNRQDFAPWHAASMPEDTMITFDAL
jgi:hypothetical protein